MGTQRTKSNLEAAVTSVITTNGIGGITGAILNTLLDDYIESLVFNNGTTTMAVETTWDSSLTGSSGTQTGILFKPTVNQSGTAGYTGLRINVTETALGSGDGRPFSVQIGGSRKFAAMNDGSFESIEMTAPGTPSSGYGFWYMDSADSKPKVKTDAGTVYDLGGGVAISGTPVNNELAVWTDSGTIEGETSFQVTANNLAIHPTGTTGSTTLTLGNTSLAAGCSMSVLSSITGLSSGPGVTTVNSSAGLSYFSAQSAAGYSYINISNTSGGEYSFGMDAVTNDNLIITTGANSGSGTELLQITQGGNFGFNGGSYGSGAKVIFIGNGTAPSGSPTAGGILYTESGALKYKGSSGTITTLGVA